MIMTIIEGISMRRFAPVLLFVLGTGALATQLGIDDAVGMALKTHPDAQIASLRHNGSKAESKSVQSSLYPRIDANIDYFPTKTFVMPTNGTFSTRQSDAFHADISGNYPIWDFGRNRDKRQAALYGEDEAESDYLSVQNSLIEQVWQRYFTVSYLRRLIDTAEQSSRFYEAQYQQAMRMREAGLKTAADESRFKASWMEADEHLRSVRNEYDKALMALALLIGSDTNPMIDDGEFDRRSDTLAYTEEDLPSLREELGVRNARLRSLHYGMQRAKALAEASAKEAYGTLSIVGSYGVDRSLSAYDSSLIGVKGNLPLYDGGKMSADAQKSRIALSIAQKEYETAEKGLWQELYGAYLDFKRSDETIAAKSGVIDATAKALDVMQGRYAQGLATYVDVMEAQSVLESARISHAGAKLQKIGVWAKIQRLLNKGCENDVCKN